MFTNFITDLSTHFGLEINANTKIHHGYFPIEYYGTESFQYRWRAPTYVDIVNVSEEEKVGWIKKVRTAVLNDVPVCLFLNDYNIFLTSKFLTLTNGIVLLYNYLWVDNQPTYLLLFHLYDLSFLKKYGFVLEKYKEQI